MKNAHSQVVAFFGVQKLLISLSKLLLFHIFVGEGLNYPNARQAVLQTGIYIGYFAAVVHKGTLHLFVLVNAENDHDRYHSGKNECQWYIYHQQKDKGTDDFNGGDKHVFRSMVCQLGNIEQVRNQLAHHFTGIAAVVVRKRKAFILVKQVLPHIAFHLCAHHMALIGDIKTAQHTNEVHKK